MVTNSASSSMLTDTLLPEAIPSPICKRPESPVRAGEHAKESNPALEVVVSACVGDHLPCNPLLRARLR